MNQNSFTDFSGMSGKLEKALDRYEEEQKRPVKTPLVWAAALLNTFAWTGFFSGVWFWIFAALAIVSTAFVAKVLCGTINIHRFVFFNGLAKFFDVKERTVKSHAELRGNAVSTVFWGIVSAMLLLL